MRYFQQSVQSSRYAYDQLIAAQCPVDDSLLMIKAANLLLARVGEPASYLCCCPAALRWNHRYGTNVCLHRRRKPRRNGKTLPQQRGVQLLYWKHSGRASLSPLPLRAKRGSGADYVTSGPSAAQTQQRQPLSHSR